MCVLYDLVWIVLVGVSCPLFGLGAFALLQVLPGIIEASA